MQNWGQEKGLPFTNYWRGMQAHEAIQEYLSKRIRQVLRVWFRSRFETSKTADKDKYIQTKRSMQEEREQIDGKNNVVKQVLAALEEEGVDTSATGDQYVPRNTFMHIRVPSF